MNEAATLLARVVSVLDTAEVKYFVTGSIASMYYGEARLTRDIDIVVHLRYGDISALRNSFAEPDFYLDVQAAVLALREEGQFNVIDNTTGMKVDFMCVERSPFMDSRFARARRVELVPGVPAWTSSPEDLILNKLRFFKEGQSDKHLRDIASMIRVSGSSFDRAYLEGWAKKLQVVEEWEAVKGKVGW